MAVGRRASPANYVKKAAGNLGVSCGNDEQDFVYGNDEQDFVYSPDGDEQIPTLARGLLPDILFQTFLSLKAHRGTLRRPSAPYAWRIIVRVPHNPQLCH
jgi:hypothetical protein